MLWPQRAGSLVTAGLKSCDLECLCASQHQICCMSQARQSLKRPCLSCRSRGKHSFGRCSRPRSVSAAPRRDRGGLQGLRADAGPQDEDHHSSRNGGHHCFLIVGKRRLLHDSPFAMAPQESMYAPYLHLRGHSHALQHLWCHGVWIPTFGTPSLMHFVRSFCTGL